jgi:hypothetical protein
VAKDLPRPLVEIADGRAGLFHHNHWLSRKDRVKCSNERRERQWMRGLGKVSV